MQPQLLVSRHKGINHTLSACVHFVQPLNANMHLAYIASLLTFSLAADGIPISRRTPQPYLPKRLIALEEHVVSPSLLTEALATGVNVSYPGVINRLTDFVTGRLAAMDSGHIPLAVLSQQTALGMDDPEGCIEANNAVRDAITANPTRFAGWAVLPLSKPDQAAAELERSVQILGFKGAMIYHHLKDGTYFDSGSGRSDPIFSKAQELDVPLYLHPAFPTPEIAKVLYAGNYIQPQSAGLLGTSS